MNPYASELEKIQKDNEYIINSCINITIKGKEEKVQVKSAAISENGSYTYFKILELGEEIKNTGVNATIVVSEVMILTNDIEKIERVPNK